MSEQLDLKKTINLPRTRFKMKANLPVLEPRVLKKWEEIGLYDQIRSVRRGQATFVLHDGPPYANGHIHLGHALNKILKDLIVKSKTMKGYDSAYVPGWDCHGLPIEIKVVGSKKAAGADPLTIRRECRQYASRFVDIQKKEFIRLGVFGEWDQPYLTMSHDYEAQTARQLGTFIEKGSVYKGLKPVHWCISCETALAEAEVEYADHTSPSVYVKFPLQGDPETLAPELQGKRVSALIWTTTPWTLPANLAICFHPTFEYSLVEVADDVYVVATELIGQVVDECGFDSHRVIGTISGGALEKVCFRHSWIDRESKSILAHHVTLEQGTGAVHTAPGHGHEDYVVGIENGLEIYNPVDRSGKFIPSVEHFAGMQVFQANSEIVDFMTDRGVLVGQQSISHSYPHCWRCHNPVIFRATPQWFIKMDHAGLREQALDAIGSVKWIPSWGEERIATMIGNRPDWCISRQRIWGVPIPVFYCKGCQEPIVRKSVVDHVADVFAREGADAWYVKTPEELMPTGFSCGCGGTDFEKEFDILDVWFDSGVSHEVVLGKRADLPWPSDVYLEGGDQYRGWFHSSLLVAVGAHGTAPYRTVICNGWTLDNEGRAMSKSLMNVISPLDVMKNNGAEILRLWVSSINYTEDVRLGEDQLSRLREAYRKLRNTQRFLLGNLADFDPKQSFSDVDFEEIDRWALARLAEVSQTVEAAYENFEFHVVYRTLYNFCTLDLSSFYFDVLKDRLYILAPDSKSRKAAQSALFVIADSLVRLLAPILPFTSEEVWGHLFPNEEQGPSVHLSEFRGDVNSHKDTELLKRWELLLQIREKVTKALEESRQAKDIGNSLEAKVRIRAHPEVVEYLSTFSEPRFIFLVSGFELEGDENCDREDVQVQVATADGEKCQRCWNYRLSVGSHSDLPTVCSRCYGVLGQIEEENN